MKSVSSFVRRKIFGYDDTIASKDIEFARNSRHLHRGGTCIIVGNGPSLTISDLELTRGLTTFASNRIFLAFSKTDWRPSYYSVEDTLVMSQSQTQIRAVKGTIKLIANHMMHFAPRTSDMYLFRHIPAQNPLDPLSDPEFPDFSHDMETGVCWGSSIVYSQIQIACHMGFETIVLLGVDHDYQVRSEVKENKLTYAGEPNHFDPDYLTPGQEWHPPNLDVLDVSYRKAAKATELMGVKVINCSRKTKLEAFPTRLLEDVLEAK